MVVLGIWVLEIGYAIVYAGWRSWNGCPMSLMDAFTGKDPCAQGTATREAPAGSSPPPAQAAATPPSSSPPGAWSLA